MDRIESVPAETYQWVVWLDDDMVATPSHLEGLIAFAKALGTAVSGSYCKRGDPRLLTWRAFSRELVRHVLLSGTDAPEPLVQCYPIRSGMGCLALSVQQFMLHCQNAPTATFSHLDRSTSSSATDDLDGLAPTATFSHIKRRVPGICASGMVSDEHGNVSWCSEDQTYGEALWYYGIKLFGVPLAFEHISEVHLIPIASATWLGNDCEFPGVDSLVYEAEVSTPTEVGHPPPTLPGGSLPPVE